jgi:hypothetical protein
LRGSYGETPLFSKPRKSEAANKKARHSAGLFA